MHQIAKQFHNMEQNSSFEEGSRSVHLQISEIKETSNENSQSDTILESHISSIGGKESIAETYSVPLRQAVRAPEKKLTLFAFRLAVLEKSATVIGTLGFIWATVVLLGGFAILLGETDFWFITFILLFEGTRIFGRSSEIDWQLQATWLTESEVNKFQLLKSHSISIWNTLKCIFIPNSSGSTNDKQTKEPARTAEKVQQWNGKHLQTRRWESSEVSLVPYTSVIFQTRNVGIFLQCLQIAAAIASVVLSLTKLILRNFGEVQKGDTDKRNRKAALIIFYSLAMAEASLFLLEKVYWQYKMSYCKILEMVKEESDLGPSSIVFVKRFFYDSYSKCVYGSLFDGLKMDMVSFAMELLASSSFDEQLMGTRILQRFALSEQFSDDTLQKIGIASSTVERLIEKLNWKDPQDKDIRQSAAEILSKLAGKGQNSLRVAGIPGAMESIGSLLYNHTTSESTVDKFGQKNMIARCEHCDFSSINNVGLLILKKLAQDYDNCGKIGTTRNLLPKLIDFTHAEEIVLKSDNNITQIQMVKRALQVVKRLACATGATGKQLRREISENVFTNSSIRDILRHGEKQPKLQKLGIDILTSLAMEDEATKKIEGTGGMLKELLNIFFKDDVPEEQGYVRSAAGEALVMLALESQESCERILKLGVLKKLVLALEVKLLRVIAAGILRNLYTYSKEDCIGKLKGVTIPIPTVLQGIDSEEVELQEAMVGLAARTFKFMTKESCVVSVTATVKKELANTLVNILKRHQYPSTRFSKIRRFTIELAIRMMEDQKSIQIFKNLRLEKELENVLDTTSEVESFRILSGSVGLSRFEKSMQSLVEEALNLMQNKGILEASN